jgi:hypothetical protein
MSRFNLVIMLVTIAVIILMGLFAYGLSHVPLTIDYRAVAVLALVELGFFLAFPSVMEKLVFSKKL